MAQIADKVKEAFIEAKNELGFKAEYDDIERAFFIEDHFEEAGYVSSRFAAALRRRMANLFWNWNGYLHNIIMPNPNSMVMVAESQMFTPSDRVEILDLMNQIMVFVSRNGRIGMDYSPSAEAEYIDDALKFYSDVLRPRVAKFTAHMHEEWMKKASEKPKLDSAPRQH